MEYTDDGIKLTGDEAQVFGHVIEMSGDTDRFPYPEAIDYVQLRQIIRPFGFGEPHVVEIAREDFKTVVTGANAVLSFLNRAAHELSRDPVGDPMPLSATALRSLATTVEIRNAMAAALHTEELARRMERYQQRRDRL